MWIVTVVAAVAGLHLLFFVALMATRAQERHDAAFAAPPTHVRVLWDDPYDPRRTAADDPVSYVTAKQVA